MLKGPLLAGVVLAVLCCVLTPASAWAQADQPGANPGLSGEFPNGNGSQATPTPTPEETATPAPTATAEPTATPRPTRRGELANTGSDTSQVVLFGLTLLGFGLALRFRLALGDDARSHD